MEVINCSLIKEKAYVDKLENGLKIIVIPKKEANKKYIIWGTNFGSNDNRFIYPETGEEVIVPDGVAHFLEHKMFEQPNGTNSLDVLMALGLDANAYTTNDHTAYLFECSEDDTFYKGLDEFMDYVQSPYYTDQNVEKEKGIIGQEIMMYDDDPGFQLYLDTLQCLYEKHPIRIDIAGTIETISGIHPDILYKCYNTFYNPGNMVLVVSGNFEPEEIKREIVSRLKPNKNIGNITRIFEEEPEKIYKDYAEKTMSVSMPIFMVGIKDKVVPPEEKAKRHMAIEIIMGLIAGKSSALYKNLYENQNIFGEIDSEYEFSKNYAHILISGQSNNPQLVKDMLITEFEKIKNEGINKEDFERVKRKIYGDFVTEFNDVASIGRMFLADSIKEVRTFDYVDKYNDVTIEYTTNVLNEVFNKDKVALSVVKGG
ncbi:MAG: insulinase family protein [Clostridia bacterium]|nr:insulinase family protein [Clostridia bacterium]